jgi:hypothetical protein
MGAGEVAAAEVEAGGDRRIYVEKAAVAEVEGAPTGAPMTQCDHLREEDPEEGNMQCEEAEVGQTWGGAGVDDGGGGGGGAHLVPTDVHSEAHGDVNARNPLHRSN